VNVLRRSKTKLLVVYESAYVVGSQRRKTKRGMDVKTFARFAKLVGVIEFLAEEAGHQVMEVSAQEWQMKILPIKPFTRREERALWAQTVAKGIVKEHLDKEEEVDVDVSCAICLGQYVSSREEFKELLEEVEDEHQ